MKKTYILIFEFEAEIKEKVHGGNKKRNRYFNTLLAGFLKNDKVVRDIYRLWLMSDLGSDNHIYEIDRNMNILRGSDELKVIRPVLQSLPEDARAHFEKVFELDREQVNEYFELLFDQFGTLKVKRANFLEKGK